MIIPLIEGVSKVMDKLRFRDTFVKKRSFIVDVIAFDFFAVPFAKLLSRWPKITPNFITVVALLISLVGIYFFYLGGHKNLLIGAAFMFVGNVFDGTDGKLARINNVSSPFGAKLDSHADKVRKILALLALAYSSTYAPTWHILILIAIQYLINYIPYEKSTRLDKIYAKNGIKSLFEPLDALILLIIIGPALNLFIEVLVFTIILQILKIIVNKIYA